MTGWVWVYGLQFAGPVADNAGGPRTFESFKYEKQSGF